MSVRVCVRVCLCVCVCVYVCVCVWVGGGVCACVSFTKNSSKQFLKKFKMLLNMRNKEGGKREENQSHRVYFLIAKTVGV